MIDVQHQLNAVRRSVGRKTFEAREARVVSVSQTYDTDAADLWDACTSIERIPRWFLPVTGDLQLGGRFQLEGNASGEVLSCDPPRFVHHHMGGHGGDQLGGGHHHGRG